MFLGEIYEIINNITISDTIIHTGYGHRITHIYTIDSIENVDIYATLPALYGQQLGTGYRLELCTSSNNDSQWVGCGYENNNVLKGRIQYELNGQYNTWLDLENNDDKHNILIRKKGSTFYCYWDNELINTYELPLLQTAQYLRIASWSWRGINVRTINYTINIS